MTTSQPPTTIAYVARADCKIHAHGWTGTIYDLSAPQPIRVQCKRGRAIKVTILDQPLPTVAQAQQTPQP